MESPPKKARFESTLDEIQANLETDEFFDDGDEDVAEIRIKRIREIERLVWEANMVHKDNNEAIEWIPDKISKYSDFAGYFKMSMKQLKKWKDECSDFLSKM